MQSFTNIFNILAGLGSLVLLALIVVLLLSRFIRAPFISVISRFVSRNRVALCLGIALAGTVSSLIYSNVIGYPPCNLCWLQRIFLYSQVVILLIALTKRFSEREVLVYVFWLSLIGALIAAYHTLITFTGINPIPCDATVSCTARYVYEFGFITIPTMSLIAFLSLVTIAKSFPQRLLQH